MECSVIVVVSIVSDVGGTFEDVSSATGGGTFVSGASWKLELLEGHHCRSDERLLEDISLEMGDGRNGTRGGCPMNLSRGFGVFAGFR